MRLFSVLFALYLACLSCLACADEVVVCLDQPPTATVVTAAHHDCGTGTIGDWCSPLCQCHCCGGLVVPPAAVATLVQPPVLIWGRAVRPAALVTAAPTRAPGAVWQPPRA